MGCQDENIPEIYLISRLCSNTTPGEILTKAVSLPDQITSLSLYLDEATVFNVLPVSIISTSGISEKSQ
jgi:hypothetical protein